MYTILTSYAKSKEYTQEWVKIDPSQISFATLYKKYRNVYLILKEPFTDRVVGFNLDKLKVVKNTSSQTLQQYLTGIGNTSLATDYPARDFTKHYAKYADVFHAGYKVNATNMLYAEDSPLTRSDKPDLKLTKTDLNYAVFEKNALVNVNGLFHYTQVDQNGIYVKDGMKSCLLSNQNQAGILSFYDVGEITTIPITADLIYRRTPSVSLYDECLLKLEQDITNKHVAIVVGGYLHFLDNRVISISNSKTIRFNFKMLPLLERYYESKNIIDLTSLPLEKVDATSTVSIESLKSDAVLQAYLLLSQSFIVLINNTDIFIEQDYLKQTPNRNALVSVIPPFYPVVAGYGKILNTWYAVEDGLFNITAKHNHRNNYVVNTVNADQVTVGSPLLGRPIEVSHSNNYFLKIGTLNKVR